MIPFRALMSLASLALSLLALPALAVTGPVTSDPRPPANALLDLVCFNARTCNVADLPDMGMDLLYVFGGRPTTAGLDIEISTTGSLYVEGPIRADRIDLDADEIFVSGGLGPIDFPPIIKPPDYPSRAICGCISTVNLGSGGGLYQLGDQSLHAVTRTGPPSPSPLTLSLVLDGDVYFDLSEFEHARITLSAKEKIVVADAMVVPEPGTALLLGLGLLGLAVKR